MNEPTVTLQTLGFKSPSDVKKLKTMNELSAFQRALIEAIASRELTVVECRPIQKELSALQRKWQKQANEARAPQKTSKRSNQYLVLTGDRQSKKPRKGGLRLIGIACSTGSQ